MRDSIDVTAEAVYTPAASPGDALRRRTAARRGSVPALAAALLLAACATGGARVAPAAPGTQPPDTLLVRAAEDSTAPRVPVRIRFDWKLTDRDARFSGRGAARVAPPYHARLDLFGPRGETYLVAGLVDMDLRLPPGASADAPVPPPAFLWSSLGVFRPPAAPLVAARQGADGTLDLEFSRGEDHWRFTFVHYRLRHAEWTGATGRQTVEIDAGGPLGLPGKAVYRDWTAFRELTLTLDQADEVDAFPSGIWTPGGN